MRIAVAGGTGTLGRHVTGAAGSRGHDVVVLARSAGADVLHGHGLDALLEGVDVVIDVLNITTLSTRKAVDFFSRTTHNLLKAETRAEVPHHVALSIVGIDRIDSSYYAGKLAQERLLQASSVPHTIARAAQFHEFAVQVLQQTTMGPFVLAPRTLTRPVAAREVAAHLLSIAETEPSGRAVDLVGPQDDTLAGMLRKLLAHDENRKRVVDLRFPGRYGAGLASGALRGAGARAEGRVTFAEWLDSADHQR